LCCPLLIAIVIMMMQVADAVATFMVRNRMTTAKDSFERFVVKNL